MNNNYISYPGPTGQIFIFFDDTKPARIPPENGAVFRRPYGKAWKNIPQIIGEYDTRPIDSTQVDEVG